MTEGDKLVKLTVEVVSRTNGLTGHKDVQSRNEKKTANTGVVKLWNSQSGKRCGKEQTDGCEDIN